jgi:restriction system protein
MRQALPGVCCLLAAGLLIPAVLLNGRAALASSIQVDRPVIACVDPRAVLALSEKGVAERHGSRWRANLVRRGRCFSILPGERWEQINSVGSMLLMRKTPPQPGVPPLYFRAASLFGAPDDARTAGGMETPVLEPPGQSVRTRVQSQGDTGPATSGASQPSPGTAPVSPSPFPQALAGPAKAASGSDILAPDISAASERGYAIGFAIAIMLIVVLLTGFALLLRELLRRPGDPANPWGPEADPIREPKLRPAPQIVPQPFSGPPLPVRRALARRPAPDPASLLQTAGLPREAEWPHEDGAQLQCTATLREAGWSARVRYESDRPYADVVASRGGRIMALRCLPDNMPVDEQAVEEVCLARERERADVAVILSSADFTPAARQLAAQAGIDLLHEDELRAFVA